MPENRADPRSRLIALPVTQILARSSHPLAPIFHLSGGPGETNMATDHDVIPTGCAFPEQPTPENPVGEPLWAAAPDSRI